MYINKLHKYLITFNECRGPSGTLIKEQGSYNLVQNGGNKGPVLRPRCIWPGRARIQTLFYSIQFNECKNRIQRILNPLAMKVDYLTHGVMLRKVNVH